MAGVFDYSYVGSTGMPSQITNPNGTKAVYSYDALARLEQMSNKTSANANLSTFAYGFDPSLDPQRGVRTSLDKTIGSNPTQRASYGYDTVDQLTSEVLSIGGTPQWSKSFAYDVGALWAVATAPQQGV